MLLHLHLFFVFFFLYIKGSQKQTLPVAPRTRTSQEELLAEMVQGQSRTSRISPPIKEEETKGDNIEKIQGNNLMIFHSVLYFFMKHSVFSSRCL